MQIVPVRYNFVTNNQNTQNSVSFGHGHKSKNNHYSRREKNIVAGTTALGVCATTALLAKGAGYSLNPAKMVKNIKNSYLAKVQFGEKEVIGIGAGSCLGGLAGGYMIDKNPENRRAKNREALMHFGNISIPILTVGFMVDKVFAKSNKWLQAAGGIAGVFAGVYLANFIMNKICNFIFQTKSDERGVKLTDFPAHLDDAVVAANKISSAKPIHYLGRAIPLALMVAGNEVGTHVAGEH